MLVGWPDHSVGTLARPFSAAGQNATSQRTVADDCEPVFLAQGKQFNFDIAIHDIVQRLHTAKGVQVESIAGPQGFAQSPRPKVGAGDVMHLAAADHIVEGSQRFFNRRFVIRRVHVVNINKIGVQPAEAAVEFAHEMQPGSAAAVWAFAHRLSAFGGQYDVVSAIGDGLAHDDLGLPCIVNVGGIEEVYAVIQCPLHDTD